MNKKKWWKLETQFHLKKFSVCSVIDQIIQSDTEKIMSFLREEFGWMDLYLKIIRHDWSDNVIWSLKWYFLINQLLVLGIFLRRYCSINQVVHNVIGCLCISLKTRDLARWRDFKWYQHFGRIFSNLWIVKIFRFTL